jgi:hypothetical protein
MPTYQMERPKRRLTLRPSLYKKIPSEIGLSKSLPRPPGLNRRVPGVAVGLLGKCIGPSGRNVSRHHHIRELDAATKSKGRH